jgi:hypothetical protein
MGDLVAVSDNLLYKFCSCTGDDVLFNRDIKKS